MRVSGFLPLLLIFLFVSDISLALARSLEVRVGIYQNPPLVFQDEAGEPQGLYPDLLRAVAEAEGWSLTFVPGTFVEGFDRLRRGEIDLMTAIAARDDRLPYVDFSRQNVLLLWSEILSRPEADVHGLVELHKRRVAVSRGGNNFEEFAKLCRQFNLVPDYVIVDDFSSVLQSVADGHADAGVVSKIFAATQRKKYGLVSTGIIFNPFSVHFAAPKGLGNGLLEVIDQNLYAWQNDNNSVYYQSLNRWLDIDLKAPASKLPRWLYPLAFSLIGCLLVAVAWVVTLRRKVRQATAAIAAREKLAHVKKDLLQQIIDNMPIGVWLSDADGRLLLENPAGREIWGRKGLQGVTHYGELRGWWADTGKPLAREDWGLVRALRDGQACLEERIEIETVDGHRKILLASAVPLFDEQGRITGGLEIEQDITAQCRAEREILKLARNWQETFDAVGDAISILDRERRVVQYNRAFKTLVGKETLVIEDGPCCQYLHGAESPADCPLARMEVSRSREISIFRRDNRWYAVRVDPLIDEQGDLTGAIHVVSEITERKEFEAMLADERQTLEMVASGTPFNEVLDKIALNIESHIQGAICSILLISDDGTALQHGASPSLPPDYSRIVEGVAIGPEVGSSGTAAYLREMIIANDMATDTRWESLRVTLLSHDVRASWSLPVLDVAGEPLAVLTIYCRQPRAPLAKELELAERGVHLLQVVLERRKRGQERHRLIKLLEERNYELEQFTYTVSHDLKTPLVTIGGFVGQLREDLKAGREDCVAIDLDFIENSVKTMSALLANLLHLARAGRAISEEQPVDLQQVMCLALDFSQGELGNIAVLKDFPAELPVVHGDPARLREAVQNLVENAAKFCRESPDPQIQVGCRVEGERVVCWVSDNGIGIEPKYHTKIFGLFEKLDVNRAGTGIGLAVSRRIVEKHGGRLWVVSAGTGQGATFFLSIPLVQS